MSLFSHAKALISAALLLTSVTALAANLSPAADSKLAPNADISLPSLTGAPAKLSDFRGQVVLVDFWATWCGPCRESFPWMNEMQNKYRDQGFKIVAINLDQDASLIAPFTEDFPANFSVLMDSEFTMPEAFGVIGMPTSFLLDRNGYVRATHVGFKTADTGEYEAAIQALLAE